MRSYSRLRRLAILRRANRELFYDLQSWSWWFHQFCSKLLPAIFFALVFGALGALLAVEYVSKQIDSRFICTEV